MKIDKFDRTICKKLGEAMLEAVKKIEDEYGIHIDRKGGSFTETSYTAKFEASVVAKDGTALTREAESFKLYCSMYNLEAEDLGRTFRDGAGTEWQVTGINARSHKYPIVAKRVHDGKGFKLGERMVQKGLGRKVSVEGMY